MKNIWMMGLVVLLAGCAGDMQMASRSELDGEPVVTLASAKVAPSGAVESIGAPENPLPIPPPPVPSAPLENPSASTILSPVPMGKATTESVVVIETAYGKIVVRLYDKIAPKTAENFKRLVSEGYYNETALHRVVPGFVIQGGDPNTRNSHSDRSTHGAGGPGYTIIPEPSLPHLRGSVAMARLENDVNPDRRSHGSQFYICLNQLPSLDGEYTVFGQVIEGMEVADRMVAVICDEHDNPKERLEISAHLENRKVTGSE